MFSSLKSVFGLYFIGAAVIPLLVFGFLADRYLARQHLAQIEHELNLHTLDIRQEVDRLLDEEREVLLLAGAICNRLAAGQATPAEIDLLLQEMVSHSKEISSLYRLDQHQRVQNLGLSRRYSGRVEDFRGLDLSGQPIIARLRERSGWSRDVVWSDVFMSMMTGEPSLSLAMPLDSGTLLETISLARLGTALTHRLAHREGVVFAIVDQHGTLVAHSDPQLVVERTNVLKAHPEIAEGLASGREIVSRFHEDESLLESLRVVNGPRWVVHASLDRETALQPLREVRMLLAGTVAGAALVSVALAVWLAMRISGPLLRLNETVGLLAAGVYDKVAVLRGARFREVDELTGNVRHMAETVRDREANLRASEERFRSLVEGMGEGLVIVDRDGMVVDANRSAERILGRQRSELLGAGLMASRWRVIGEDGQPLANDELPSQVTLRDGVEVSNRILGMQHADGREIWIQVNTRPLFKPSGEVELALVTFSDVSGLKAAEEALRVNKLRFQELYQQFSALLEGITDRILLISPQMRLIWTNQETGSGCLNDNLIGTGDCCYERFFSRADPCPGCPAAQCIAGGEPAFGEMNDGRGRIWDLRAFPVIGSAGAVRNVVMIAEDITERREAERQQIRAGQLAALGELAAGVAHEINNPISGVINYAQLILNRAQPDSRDHELARRIIKEGDRIATIVRELLTFAREESADIAVVSLGDALGEALALCESQLRKEGVELRVDLPADLPPVESRSHQIQQLFLNLISNARHALNEKYPAAHADKILQITARPVVIAGRPGVRLAVRDHGTGIPAGLLDRVLNPFVTTKPAGVGTGLGLSISFEIAKKHGGHLSIASEHGHWTEVTVDLPSCVMRGEAAP